MSIQPAPGPEATPPRAWVRPDLDGGPIDDPTPVDLPVLLAEVLAVDLTGSAPITRLERLSSLGAIDAALHALRLETIASLSPAEPADHWAERHVVEELRLAMGVSDRYADALLGQARAVFGAHFTEPDPATAGAEVVQTEPGDVELGGTQLEQGEAGDADGDGTYEPGHAAPFAVMGALLAAGSTSAAHVRVLAEVTSNVADDPALLPDQPRGKRPWRSREDKLTEIATRTRRAAARNGVVGYRRAVRRVLLLVDGDAQAGRAAVADAGRGVVLYPGEDGQARIAADGPMVRSRQLYKALNEHADRLRKARGGVAAARRGVLDARIGPCRYDALHALVTGIPAACPTVVVPDDASTPSGPTPGPGAVVVSDDDCPTGSMSGEGTEVVVPDDNSDGDGPAAPASVLPGMPTAPTVTTAPETRPRLDGQLVIDARTLSGLVEHPGLLDGEPIPAAMARALALDVEQWRRLVTDPRTGHLLDYGTTQYTPRPLWRWARTRDGGCTAPDCHRGLYRSQVDHRTSYPTGGSDRDNVAVLCTTGTHHQIKTNGWIQITDSHADGSMTWRTAWGQVIRTPPSVHLPGFDEWAEHDDGLPTEPPAPTRPAPEPPPRPAADPDEQPPF